MLFCTVSFFSADCNSVPYLKGPKLKSEYFKNNKTLYRGKDCKHLQCFNAQTFLLANANFKTTWQSKNAWTCPICANKLPLKFLVRDQYFVDILASKDLLPEANDIILVSTVVITPAADLIMAYPGLS